MNEKDTWCIYTIDYTGNRAVQASIAAVATGSLGYLYLSQSEVHASAETADTGMHAPHYPWSFNSPFKTFDHAAIRRGYQVYKEVCSACHSMNRIAFRNLVNVTHSKDEARALAEDETYIDGPDDQGEMFERPGKLSDYLPAPYPNDEAARAGNAGALPPDLSLIVKARHGGPDYIFALLTGYCDPPAGVEIRQGLNYNPYFPGGAIAMARVLYDGVVEYEDGTPATASQMAKDVSEFLSWASEPEHDERKRLGFKVVTMFTILTGLMVVLKRMRWAPLKTRKIVFKPPTSAGKQ
ncbi:cytochrome c1 [Syncephalis fuscata]|nr:cytochrome c1 [Syncephalis fuscata]